MKFSVLMSIYKKEKAEFLKEALDSVINQTAIPSEIVMVKDGALTDELEKVLEEYQTNYPHLFKIVPIEVNKGLGNALNIGIENCSYEIVARMDADDIARSDRFEIQLKFLEKNPDISVVGSWITEFDEDPDVVYAKRIIPTESEEIRKFAKWRCPMNHMTVMYKKSVVLQAGNYSPPNKILQDYELWVRLFLNNVKFANIPDFLVNARAGKGMFSRRKGLYYIGEEFKLFSLFLSQGFINIFEFVRNIVLKTLLRVIPEWSRVLYYNKFLRG